MKGVAPGYSCASLVEIVGRQFCARGKTVNSKGQIVKEETGPVVPECFAVYPGASHRMPGSTDMFAENVSGGAVLI